MKKTILTLVILFVLPSLALAVKPDNPGGGDKFDAEAAIQAETDARIATEADLQNQINDNAADIQTNTDAINAISSGLKVYDGNGQFLGIAIGFSLGQYNTVYSPELDAMFTFDMQTNDIVRLDYLYFDTDNCSGAAGYSKDGNEFSPVIYKFGTYSKGPNARYFYFANSPQETFVAKSWLSYSGCSNISPLAMSGRKGYEVTLPFQIPLTLPFNITQ